MSEQVTELQQEIDAYQNKLVEHASKASHYEEEEEQVSQKDLRDFSNKLKVSRFLSIYL